MTPIALLPFGRVPGDVLDEMSSALAVSFPAEITALPPLPVPATAWDDGRGQFSAPEFLRITLDLHVRSGRAGKTLAVTAGDLFIPMLTFVYGQAQLGGCAGVVSLARLTQEFYGLEPNARLLVARARKEAVHETGHLFGLVHCLAPDCAMRLSTNIRQIDLKDDHLCGGCAAGASRGPHYSEILP
jgi:archaemetzincin